jgi:hypothetical protein
VKKAGAPGVNPHSRHRSHPRRDHLVRALVDTNAGRAVSLLSITWSMAGGAPFVPPGPPSGAGSRPPTPVPAVKGRPEAERGHQGRPRRPRAGDLRGRAVFRSGP